MIDLPTDIRQAIDRYGRACRNEGYFDGKIVAAVTGGDFPSADDRAAYDEAHDKSAVAYVAMVGRIRSHLESGQ